MDDNWELIVPPDPANTEYSLDRGEVPAKLPIRLMVPALTQGALAFFPYLANSGKGITEYTQFPAYMHMQIKPKKQIPMVVWEGVSDYRELASL